MPQPSHGHNVIPFGGTPPFGTGPSALIFDHLHKCAGTTFRHQLASHFPDFYDASFLEAWARDYPALQQTQAPRLAIAGHTALGMHELLPAQYNAYYITVLREPYARALSEHRFLRDWHYPTPPLADFIRHMKPNFLVNRLGNGSLELALNRLHSFYFLFGLTERFDDFLAHLSAVTALDFSVYTSRNRSNTHAEKPPASLRAEFDERNTLDLQLYQAAKVLFDERFRAISPPAHMSHNITATKADESIPTSPEITDLIDQGRFVEAARRVDAITPRDEAERLQLLTSSALLFQAARQLDEAATRAHSATLISAESAITEAAMLEDINPEAARSVLLQALVHFRSVVSNLPDSHLNRFRASLRQALAQLEKKACATYRWHQDEAAFQHARQVITKLTELDQSTKAKPVRVALYGNGRHTEWLLTLLHHLPFTLQITMILDDNAGPSSPALEQDLVPVHLPAPSLATAFDVIIPSTDANDAPLLQRCRELFPQIPVHSLYTGFPPGPYHKINPTLAATLLGKIS